MLFLKKNQLRYMKFLFSFLFFFIFCNTCFSKNFETEYIIKTKGVKIGILFWKLNIDNNKYNTEIALNNKGPLSMLYKFEGKYKSYGLIKDGKFLPSAYNQLWKTKKKERDVSIVFGEKGVKEIVIIPREKEVPRFDYQYLHKHVDPISSFLQIIYSGVNTLTIDGRRAYLLSPMKKNNSIFVLVKNYKNLWADHKRNDLEYIEFIKEDGFLFPKNINIMFKGGVFSLNRV